METEIQHPVDECHVRDLNSSNTVIPPHHDFFNFNRTRCNSALRDRVSVYCRHTTDVLGFLYNIIYNNDYSGRII